MRRLTLLLVSLVLLSIQSVLAQSFSVKGTVVSAEDNEPMIGVTIMQEGTSNGVVTDIDGNYTIEIKGASKATLAGGKLRPSFAGTEYWFAGHLFFG